MKRLQKDKEPDLSDDSPDSTNVVLKNLSDENQILFKFWKLVMDKYYDGR